MDSACKPRGFSTFLGDATLLAIGKSIVRLGIDFVEFCCRAEDQLSLDVPFTSRELDTKKRCSFMGVGRPLSMD